MNKSIPLITFLILTACVSEQEQREAMYRHEETMRNQCEHTLGFKTGTPDYMDCRIFYDEYLDSVGYSTDSMSFTKAQNIKKQLESLNTQCAKYWGREGISRQYLWSCVQRFGQKQIERVKHDNELKEQEEMLTRSIAAGQKEANDSARLQERIDAERDRVAKETGKNPKKIYCTTRTQANGYIKVKCK